MIRDTEREKAQVGIGTLIVFIAMVLVAAIAAGVLINTAGFLQSQSEQTGQESASQVSDRLQVVNVIGDEVRDEDGDGNAEAEVIYITVKKAPGANDVDLEAVTAQFVSDAQIVDVVHTDSNLGQPGTSFDTAPIEDDDGSISATNVINDQTDRAQIIFDLGDHDDSHDHDDVAAVDSGDISPPLDEGEQATIQLTTEAGGETTPTLSVPETLSQKTSVTL